MLNKLKNAYQAVSENTTLWILTCLSIFISVRIIYIQHDWINNDDTVLYFEVAKLFANGAWKQGFALYNWPLYPALIAAIHHFTPLGIQPSAQVLDVLFFAITTYSFLTLIRLAGGDKTTILCAGLLLFGSDYIVGSVLPMLLRDQGFWAFFLTGLVFFIRFYRKGQLTDALIWQICAVIATLFRIEAITFLFLIPFILIKNAGLTKREQVIRIAQAHTINLIGLIALTLALVLNPSTKLANLGRLQEALMLNHGQIIQGLTTKTDIMGQAVLGSLSEYAFAGLILTLVWILLIKSAEAGGWLCVGLILFAYRSAKHKANEDVKIILLWVSALALLNMSIIMLRTYVLSGRYVIPIGFIIILFASFGLASLFKAKDKKSQPRTKWILAAILVFLSLSLLKNITPKKEGYNYQQDAIAWVKSTVPVTSSVLYDSQRLRFYAGLPLTERGIKPWDVVTKAINDKSIDQYDYLVIHVNKKNPEHETYLIKTLNLRKITEFRADNGNRILILKKTRVVVVR